jgi:hypothetical protein
MHRRADVAEIPGIDDDPPVGVGGGQALQQPLPFRPSTSYRWLTGQSLLRAQWNSNRCNCSTARKKIGPVNRPCDRPIDVISIASLIILVASRLAGQQLERFSQR